MKVILIKDVEKLGKRGDIKDVSDGYARNFLIPRKLIQIATDSAINQINKERKAKDAKLNKNRELLEKQALDLKNLQIIIKAKADDSNKLYGSINRKDVAKEINVKTDLNIDEKMVKFPASIKKLGDFKIAIVFNKELEIPIKLKVSKI